jgi:hypothetical protein
MSDFLDKLKSDMQEAHARFQTAQQKFNAAQAESQAAQQRLAAAQAAFGLAAAEFQAHQTLIAMHTRKEQQTTGTAPATGAIRVATPATPAVLPAGGTAGQNSTASQSSTDDNKSDGNKTQAVRDLLRQHPTGMTPGEIWKALETKVSNRAYLYSVLKRLRDKGDAREKRGKYYLVPKIEESQTQMVQ